MPYVMAKTDTDWNIHKNVLVWPRQLHQALWSWWQWSRSRLARKRDSNEKREMSSRKHYYDSQIDYRYCRPKKNYTFVGLNLCKGWRKLLL